MKHETAPNKANALGQPKAAPLAPRSSKSRFIVEAFTIDIEKQSCICPAGKELWLKCAKAKNRQHTLRRCDYRWDNGLVVDNRPDGKKLFLAWRTLV